MNRDTERRIPTGMDLIAAERCRQVEGEGYTFGHDLQHGPSDLRAAAGCYVTGSPTHWPWALAYWKPKDRLSNLIRAGALHLAAVDVLNATSRPDVKTDDDFLVAGCAYEIDAILAKAHSLIAAPDAVHEQEVRADDAENAEWWRKRNPEAPDHINPFLAARTPGATS